MGQLGNISAPTVGFLSQLFVQNPKKIEEWLEPDLNDQMQNIVTVALFLVGMESYAPMSFQKQILKDSRALSEIPSLVDLSPSNPAEFDLLWGALFASESPVFLDIILSVFDDSKSPTGSQKNDEAVLAAAFWSIRSNMLQHAFVERLIQDRLKNSEGSTQNALKEIWRKFEDEKSILALQKQDGDFQAALGIFDPEITEERNVPLDQIANVESAVVKRGRRSNFLLTFGGFELSKNYDANVTYNIRIISPDGRIFLEKTGLETLVARTPIRLKVFNAKEEASVEFDTDDTLGTYRVTVEITDHITGKKLYLEQFLELG